MRKGLVCLAAAWLLLASSAAFAQWTTIYQTGFDTPPYTLNSTVNGVDGWTTANVAGNAIVVADPTTPGNQLMYLTNDGSNDTYRALPHPYTGGHVRLTFVWAMTDAGINSGDTAQNMWTIINDSTTNSSNRTGMLNSTYDATSGEGTLYAFNAGVGWTPYGSFVLGEKHLISMDLDLDTRLFDVYLDGTLAGSGFHYYSSTANTASYLHFWKRYKTGSFAVDDVKLEVTPEPSSLLALATGFLGLGGFAIRRRRR